MPVVPFTGREPFEPQRPQMPDEPWALMAAAQMHSEGRLLEPAQIPIRPHNALPDKDNMVAKPSDTRDENEFTDTTSQGTFITDPRNQDHRKM